MPASPSPMTESDEEARALLQTRVALFWKVIFGISALSLTLGLFGFIMKPRGETAVLALQALEAAIIWRVCSRGERSVAFLRTMESGGLFLNISASAWLGRYATLGFIAERAITS